MDKIINLLINNWTKGVDTYTHNGSTWLIFTEQKNWVIELTESKTLWYNYNFFKELFSLTSMDVVDNQHYITKWVEDNIINKVNYTSWGSTMNERFVGDVIEDGVKETITSENGVKENSLSFVKRQMDCEDTIQNGVKVIEDVKHTRNAATKDTIKYGVKETGRWGNRIEREVEDTIQNGVKETSHNATMFQSIYTEDTIKNGVRHTEIGWHQCNNVDDAIEYGVKETHDDAHNHKDRIDGVIKNGVKETKGHGFEQQNIIDDIVKDGVKETNHIKNNVRETKHFEEHLGNTIDDVINEGMIETSHRCLLKRGEIEDIIDGGVKYTKPIQYKYMIEDIIQNGVKETKTPGNGDIVSTVEWMKENNSTSYPKMIDDVIENGEKINGTYVGGKRQKENIEVVIDYGVKQTKPIGKESPNHPKVVINHIIQNGTKNPSV